MRPLRAFAGRLAAAAGLLVLLSAIVYIGVDLLPGDPVSRRLGLTASPERVAEVRRALGLDRPVWTRYLEWLAGLVDGSLGTSITGQPVGAMIADRLGNSAVLAGLALAVLVPLSLVLGLVAARRPGGAGDRAVSTGSLLLVSVPEFVIAGALVAVVAVNWRLLPALSVLPPGSGPLSHPEVLVLPVTTLVVVGLAYSVRVIRGAAVSAVSSPHVEHLRLSGVPHGAIVRTAVVPAVLPVAVQAWAVTGVSLVGGAVLVEKVFAYPGIGDLLVASVLGGDLPVVQALVLLLGAAMLLALLLADLAVHWGTPRLRTGEAR